MADIEKAVAKRIARTWMAPYDTTERADLAAMGDSALTLAYRRFKGPINDRSKSELAEIAALFAELTRRHCRRKAAQEEQARQAWAQAEAAGCWPNSEIPIPAVGAKVSKIYPGLFGIPMRIHGRVYRAKVGLRVRLDAGQPIAGAKTVDLDRGWRTAL